VENLKGVEEKVEKDTYTAKSRREIKRRIKKYKIAERGCIR
jgi:hypothetical protein